MEMLAIMAQADRYGYMATNGKAITTDQLARLIGSDNETVKVLMSELMDAGVPSLDGDVVYSRRMVREMKIHEAAVASGRRGGNPSLLKIKEEPISQKPEARDTHKPTLNGTLKGIEKACALAKASHPDFENVPDVAIINVLRGYPESRWEPAIKKMGDHYAGARMTKPVGHLDNYLAGKNGEHKSDPKTGQRVKYD